VWGRRGAISTFVGKGIYKIMESAIIMFYRHLSGDVLGFPAMAPSFPKRLMG
jgi:hypothetical protein